MSKFHYVPDMQETVTRALGDGWKPNYRPHCWRYDCDLTYFDEIVINQGLWGARPLWMSAVIDDLEIDENTTLNADELEQLAREAVEVAVIIRAAEDRLRAAGLVEITEG